MEARLFSSYTVYEIENVIHHKGIYISLEMQIRKEKNSNIIEQLGLRSSKRSKT